ncbi:MAG: hypothetical protein ACRDNF_04475 [Streptosporangiaceae bacterium]
MCDLFFGSVPFSSTAGVRFGCDYRIQGRWLKQLLALGQDNGRNSMLTSSQPSGCGVELLQLADRLLPGGCGSAGQAAACRASSFSQGGGVGTDVPGGDGRGPGRHNRKQVAVGQYIDSLLDDVLPSLQIGCEFLEGDADFPRFMAAAVTILAPSVTKR